MLAISLIKVACNSDTMTMTMTTASHLWSNKQTQKNMKTEFNTWNILNLYIAAIIIEIETF